MKIDELKVGDRIKYDGRKITGGNLVYTGTIKHILSSKMWSEKYFNVIRDGINDEHSFFASEIICKLEPINVKYKEIPIEKENISYIIKCDEIEINFNNHYYNSCDSQFREHSSTDITISAKSYPEMEKKRYKIMIETIKE